MLLVMTFAITSQFAMANAGYGFKQYLTVDDTYTLSSTGPIKHFIGYLVFAMIEKPGKDCNCRH